MKKFKSSLMVIACLIMAATTTTSCLDSDSDTAPIGAKLTQGQKTEYIYRATGSYSGKLRYVTSANKSDSTAMSWTISPDSSFVSNNFPVSVLSEYVSNPDAKYILQAALPQKFSAVMHPYYLSSYYYGFFVIPSSESLSFTVNYKDVDYSVVIIYSTGSISNYYNGTTYYYNPIAQYLNDYIAGNILIKTVKVNGISYEINAVFSFTGTK